jgi:SulP family sulfate permease
MGNIISGACGSVHNYLSYSNSVFFFNVGGWGKSSQGAIAFSTLILFIIGPQIINFVPRIIAGVIMFHLGYDLVNDAVIASRPALDSLEYMSVLFVGVVVMIFGFVTGVCVWGGTVMLCLVRCSSPYTPVCLYPTLM